MSFEPAQIEVGVEPHHEQRRVDIGDDRLAQTGRVAARNLIDRRKPLADPQGSMFIGGCEHPVAGAERILAGVEVALRPRQRARRFGCRAVGQHHGFAMHFEHSHQRSLRSRLTQRVADRRVEADRRESIAGQFVHGPFPSRQRAAPPGFRRRAKARRPCGKMSAANAAGILGKPGKCPSQRERSRLQNRDFLGHARLRMGNAR
jgi:hypothetical protein